MTLTDSDGYTYDHPGYSTDDGDTGTPDGALGADCAGTGGYDDIAQGADVVISDDGGKTLVLTELGPGTTSDTGCEFDFKAEVPQGYKIYGIEVTHRGVVRETADEMRAGVSLTLG